MEIVKGSLIKAKHIKSGEMLHYRVVIERGRKDLFKLVNLDTFYIMSGFKACNSIEIVHYIEKRLQCEVIEISK